MRHAPRSTVFLLGFALAALGVSHAAAQSKPELVTIKAGETPIILAAPHGGRLPIPGVPERQGEGVKMFKVESDTGTDELTAKLAAALQEKMGKRPYVVIARFHRKFLDANRPKSGAYETPEAEATYDAYHGALAKARQDVIRRWGHGILLDVHGQGAERDAIFRGTQNGKTVQHLVSRFGREALIGKTSLFGQLAQQGVSVIPAVESTEREESRYGGGYTVMTYGSAAGGTLDALQLEVGKDLRTTGVDAAAGKLANGIAAFAQTYLPKAEQAEQEK